MDPKGSRHGTKRFLSHVRMSVTQMLILFFWSCTTCTSVFQALSIESCGPKAEHQRCGREDRVQRPSWPSHIGQQTFMRRHYPTINPPTPAPLMMQHISPALYNPHWTPNGTPPPQQWSPPPPRWRFLMSFRRPTHECFPAAPWGEYGNSLHRFFWCSFYLGCMCALIIMMATGLVYASFAHPCEIYTSAIVLSLCNRAGYSNANGP